MILYRWQGETRNFGDELNTILWPRLLPGFFDDDESEQFLGIGSVLDQRHQATGHKLVAGSGYGGYRKPPRLDENWSIYWVRGPRTADFLGLPRALGLGDPAALLPFTGLAPILSRTEVGFMPHFESAASGAWEAASLAAGVTLIDPRGDPLAIIAAIARCRTLLSEALHGTIVADALGVPWIAIEPLAPIHRPKWHDWAATFNLSISFRQLCPSSLLERARLSGFTSLHAGRMLLNRYADRLRGLGTERFVHQAARALRQAAAATPQLSSRSALASGQSQMLEKVNELRRWHLRPSRGSAYHPGPPGS